MSTVTENRGISTTKIDVADEISGQESVSRKRNFFQRFIFYIRGKAEFRKTLKAIEQAKQIREGRKPAKSFDQFIKEL